MPDVVSCDMFAVTECRKRTAPDDLPAILVDQTAVDQRVVQIAADPTPKAA